MPASLQSVRPNEVSAADFQGKAHGGGSHAPKSFTRPQSNPQTTTGDSPQKQTSRAANASQTPASAEGSAPQQPKADDKDSFHSILNHYYSSDSSDDSDSDSSDSGDAKGQQDSSQDSNTTAVAPVDTGTARKDIVPLTLTLAFPRNIDLPAQTQSSTTTSTTATAETQNAASTAASSLTTGIVASDAEELAPAPTPAPQIESDNAPATQRGDLAFAAKLTPVATDNGKAQPEQQSNNNSQDSGTDAKQRAQAQAAQQQTQSAAATKSTAPSPSDDSTPVADKIRAAAFAEAAPKPPTTMLAQEPQTASQTVTSTKPVETGPQTNAGEVARIEQAMNMPAAASSSHDITVRIADAGQHGADIRFVEHAGEVRVTVKTADAEMAQTLRSGLNDFANRMEQSGIRTEVWRPGTDANSPQNQQGQFADQKGRQQNRDSRESRDSGPDPQQENQNSNKPRWVEELETSLRSN